MFALGSGFDGLQSTADCEIDGLIVADLEMQERMMLDGAPVTAEQRIRADEVDGARDPAAVALGHDQGDVPAHGFADQRIECAGQVWPAPLPRARLHVEFEKR